MKPARRRKASLWLTSGEERGAVLENISLLLDSGMDLLQALSAAQSEIKSKQLQLVLNEVKIEVEGGAGFAEALNGRRLISEHELALITIGEQSGRLVQNIGVLILERQKSQLFRARLTSAMLYPLFIVVVGFIVAGGVAWFVLPKLATVFTDLHVALPKITRWLVISGTFLAKYRVTVIPAVALLILALTYVVFFFGPTKQFGEWILLHLPGTGRVLKEIEIARFGFMMGTLLDAGLPVVNCVAAVADMSSISGYRRLYRRLHTELETGQTFSDSFTKYHHLAAMIPNSLQQMIVAAEQSGNLQRTFARIGERYESKTEISTKNISVILEPILLIIVWLGVVFIAVAIMLPIYSLVGNFSNINDQPTEVSTPAPTSDTTTPPPVIIQVKADLPGTVSVVAHPDAESALITKVKSGDVFTVITQEGSWYQILLSDGTPGYISNSYVDEIKP